MAGRAVEEFEGGVAFEPTAVGGGYARAAGATWGNPSWFGGVPLGDTADKPAKASIATWPRRGELSARAPCADESQL